VTTTTQSAVPCIECGTRWGAIPRNQCRPWRARGYCRNCYQQHYARGDFDHNIGLIGGGGGGYSPSATPEYVIWHTPEGERQTQSLPFRADYDRAAVISEAEAFAAEWLAKHPQYLAKWRADEAAAA
jgi:threonine dehydrogenase-like Zn-dependent dehydrogenase